MSALLDPADFDGLRRPEMEQGWVVQVFALGADHVPAAHAMIELAMIDAEHSVAESTDGLDAYLVVETRNDPEIVDAVRVAVAMADVHASLEHVSADPSLDGSEVSRLQH